MKPSEFIPLWDYIFKSVVLIVLFTVIAFNFVFDVVWLLALLSSAPYYFLVGLFCRTDAYSISLKNESHLLSLLFFSLLFFSLLSFFDGFELFLFVPFFYIGLRCMFFLPTVFDFYPELLKKISYPHLLVINQHIFRKTKLKKNVLRELLVRDLMKEKVLYVS